MANIFRLSRGLMEEDRFTASLNYVIDCYPGVGQTLADYILTSSGRIPSRFVRSTDHPIGTAEDRPDFLLECEDIDIVCEHKIDSPLGKRQLERYLKLPREKPFYLALISNKVCRVPHEVVDNGSYIAPLDSDVPHFLWQSIYPLIDIDGNRLVTDFKDYMRSLSMKPIESESWVDLFNHHSTAKAFGHEWNEARAFFKQLGARCALDPGKLGMQIRYPNEWLHLLYVFVSPNAEPRQPLVEGPYLGARLFINRKHYPNLGIGNLDTPFEFEFGTIYPRARERQAGWNEALDLLCDYYMSLDCILTTEPGLLRKRLLSFTRAVYHHAAANRVTA